MGRTSDTREKLLQAAFELIWANNYGTVSVDHICGQANVNKGSFYHFFKTKADLAMAACELHWQENEPDLDRMFSSAIPPLERLSSWCECLRKSQDAKTHQRGRVCGCPYTSIGIELALQDEKIRHKAEEMIERGTKYVEQAIADAKQNGTATVADPKAAAAQVYSCALGLLVQAKIRNDTSILRELEPATMNLIGAQPSGSR